jgi:hypothetical protein
MADLRDEIIGSQQARVDLLKWKLIGVAALGAAGLSLGEHAQVLDHGYMALLLIPFVCVYVDVLCRHHSLRILVIAAFLRTQANTADGDYERFIKDKVAPPRPVKFLGHRQVFGLEDIALEWSTLVLSALLILVGQNPDLLPGIQDQLKAGKFDRESFLVLSGAFGAAGVLLTLIVKAYFKGQSKMLDGV